MSQRLVVLLLVVVLAGCVTTTPSDDDGEVPANGADGEDDDRDSTGPKEGGHDEDVVGTPTRDELSFAGQRAYEQALWQMYDDPDTLSGPRYRIPGTATSQAVADELHQALEAAMGPDSTVATTTFTGDDYYDLMFPPRVRSYTCPNDPDRQDDVRSITFRNIHGRTHADEWGVLIGAHWDSKKESRGNNGPILGADDGAGSVAVILELARVLGNEPVEIPVSFVLFDGEDGFEDCHALAGSTYFAQNTLGEADEPHFFVLLDMVGNSSAKFMLEGNSRSYRTTGGSMVDGSDVQEMIWDVASDLGDDRFVARDTCEVLDDHIPMLEAGIRSVDIIRYDCGFAPYWHTTADDHTAIDPAGLGGTGLVLEALVRMLGEDAVTN